MRASKAAISALFFALAACGSPSVPKPDDIEALINAGDFLTAQKAALAAGEANPGDPRITFLDGQIALALGNYDRAQTKFQALLNDPAMGSRAKVLLAKTRLMAGQPREALDLLGNGPYADGLAYAVAAGAKMATGDFDAADVLLAKGLAAYPQSTDLKVLVGERALQDGDRDRAGQMAGEAVKASPKDVPAQLLAARVALIGGKLDEADRHFDAVLALRPKHQTAMLGKATIAYDRGDRDGAKAILDAAANAMGQNAIAVGYFRAQLAFDAGKTEEANSILLGLGEVGQFPPAVMLSGLVATKRGQHEQAVALLNRFLQQGGEDGRARVALAESYLALGDRDAAWKALQPVADAANAPAAVLGMAADLTGQLGLSSSATYKSRQAAAANPGPQGQQLAAADAAIRAGDWAKANTIYTQLLAKDPASSNVILLNNAAMAATQLGDLPRAVAIGRRALAAAPNDPIVLDTLAWALFRSGGATPEAVDLMRRALAAMPGNPEIRQHALAFQGAMKTAR